MAPVIAPGHTRSGNAAYVHTTVDVSPLDSIAIGLSCTETAIDDQRLLRAIRQSQVASFVAIYSRMSMLSLAVVMMGFYLIAVVEKPTTMLAPWMVYCVLITIALQLAFAWLRRRTLSSGDFVRVERAMIPLVVLVGVCWGLLPAAVGEAAGYYYHIAFAIGAATMVESMVGYVYMPRLAILFYAVSSSTLGLTMLGRGRIGVEWTILCILFALALLMPTAFWFHLFAHGVAQQEQSERARRVVETVLTDFATGARDWLWEIDAQGILVPTSTSSVGRGSGTQPQVGSTLQSALDPDDPSSVHLSDLLARRESFGNLRVRVAQPNGMLTHWRLRGHPLYDVDGVFCGFRGVGADDSANVALEALAAEEERFDAISRLSSGLAHDVNNLLQSVVFNLELVSRGNDELLQPSAVAALDAARNGAHQAGVINSQLLAYARKETLAPELVDVRSVVEQVIAGEAARDSGVNFIVDIATDATAHCDPVLFDRALRNVVRNAVEAVGAAGAVHLSVSTGLDEAAGAVVELRVEDSGSGFDSEALHKATEPFFTTKRRSGGSGLGLSMVHGFIQQSGGTMTLENGANGGGSVMLRLPASNQLEHPVVVSQEMSLHVGADRILLVEDDDMVAASLSAHLVALGLEVSLCTCVAEAEEFLASGASFDVAVLDVFLPDGTGIAFATTLRRHHKTPIVFITGFSEGIQIPADLAPSLLLRKPFGASALLHAMQSLVWPSETASKASG